MLLSLQLKDLGPNRSAESFVHQNERIDIMILDILYESGRNTLSNKIELTHDTLR